MKTITWKVFAVVLAVAFAKEIRAQHCMFPFCYEVDDSIPRVEFQNYEWDTFATYTWTFGDGQVFVGKQAAHTYASEGIYEVCLKRVAPECSDSICRTVVAVPDSNRLGFTYSTDPLTGNVHFTNRSTGVPDDGYKWIFDDGASNDGVRDPIHTYGWSDTFEVCLIKTDPIGCTSSTCQLVIVSLDSCFNNFGYHTWGESRSVDFTAAFGSITVPDTISTYTWHFGDGDSSVSRNPQHVYADTGTYMVCLTKQNPGCSSTICKPVVITGFEPCHATFQMNYVEGFRGPMEFRAYERPTYRYAWDLGDNTTASGHNPQHVYRQKGYYNVCLTVTDTITGCTDQKCRSVYIYNDPVSTGLKTVVNELNNLQVYPVPVNDRLKISFTSESRQLATIRIVNLLGSTLHSDTHITMPGSNEWEIETHSLAKGIYLLEVFTDKERSVIRIVK